LLGTFVGDALGMPFEGVPHRTIPSAVEMVEARLGRGTYTDDTQMMIALAESLIEQGRIEEERLARAFQAVYDPARRYGGGTRSVLELWRDGVSVPEAAGQLFGGQGSRGNGAAMRIAPVGVYFRADPERLLTRGRPERPGDARTPGRDHGARVQVAAIGAALRDEESSRWPSQQPGPRNCARGWKTFARCSTNRENRLRCARGWEAPPTHASRCPRRSTRRSHSLRSRKRFALRCVSAATPIRSPR